jgi:multicomponent Na+:H+ antiporter subunit E
MLPNHSDRKPPMVLTLLWRIAILAGLWLILFPQDGVAWAIGAVIVGIAGWRSVVLVPPVAGGPNVRWLVLPPLFFWESAASAVQVAHRALWPRAGVAPAVLDYRPTARSDRATMALAWVISALPGTLVGEMEETRGEPSITVHVLDRRLPVEDEIGRMERRIAWAVRAKSGDA